MITKNFIGYLSILFCFCGPMFIPSTNQNYLYDDDDRIVIYHGLNLSNTSKSTPDNLPWTTQSDLNKLNQWGFNLVRYLVFWSAIEPQKDSINQDYIQQTIQRINWLDSLGVDVIIDLHQDLFNTKFSGNGFPSWVINDDSLPFTLQQPWFNNYYQPAVIACYRNFWTNPQNISSYLKVIKIIQNSFDSMPNVIGIDVMNEPFPVIPKDFNTVSLQNITTTTKELVTFEQNYLSPLYDSVNQIGFKKRVFFEPVIYTSIGIPTMLNFKTKSNNVYYPHYYDPLCESGKSYTDLTRKTMDLAFKIKVKEAQTMKVPLLYGEFGISTVPRYSDYLTQFLNLADRYSVGWTYYSFDRGPFGVLNNDGSDAPQLKYLVRPYPMRIAGRNPLFTATDSSLTLTYDNIGLTGLTEIFIPWQLYDVKINGVYTEQMNNVFKYQNDDLIKQKIEIYRR